MRVQKHKQEKSVGVFLFYIHRTFYFLKCSFVLFIQFMPSGQERALEGLTEK